MAKGLNQFRKKMRQVVRRNFMRLPDAMRARLERRLFQIHLEGLDPELVFKLAETKSELEQAFSLLHDAYVREGYMKPHPSGFRVTAYHAIPSTTTLIAKKGEDVVATVSVIRQSRLKLPVQTAFDVSAVAKPGDQLVEISSLAIHPKHRGQETQLLFWLSKYVLEYCQRFFAIDFMFVTINPRQIDLYENIILFRRLPAKKVDNYDFANGAPAVAEYLDMHQYKNWLMAVYWNKPPARNVYAFVMEHKLSRQFIFPQRPVYTVSDPVMTPNLLDYFFNEKTSAFAEMNDEQLEAVHEMYRGFPEYAKVIPPMGDDLVDGASTTTNRYQVRMPGTMRLDDDARLIEFDITQVSAGGFLARVPVKMQPGTRISATVKISSIATVAVEAVAIWNKGTSMSGFALTSPGREWSDLVSHLESDRNRATG